MKGHPQRDRDQSVDVSSASCAQPSDLEMEMYKQAHETRRKWENYIWQWGMIVTALVSFCAVLLASTSATGFSSVLSAQAPLEIIFLRKAMLIVLAVFLLSITLNVYRARNLMKNLDKTIMRFHQRHHVTAFPIVPCELDHSAARWTGLLSSTRYSVLAHCLAFIVFLTIAVYEVFWR